MNLAAKADKITVVGAGTIGPEVAYGLMLKELASEIILVNRDEAKGKAKASDLSHCGPVTGGTRVSYGDYSTSSGSEIVVVTAGVLADKHGTRMDVLKSNIAMYKKIIPEIAGYSPDAIMIIVTNPLDAMAYAAYKLSGFPASRVIGSGTLLDTMRFRQIIGSRLGIDSSHIEALVVGEHGESMVPIWSSAKVDGMPLQDYLRQRGMELAPGIKAEINRETERAGWNIRLGNVHTCYGIALSAIKIIEGILGFSEEAVPVSTLLSGEYGIGDIFASVPVKLGRKGIKAIETIDMSSDEKKLLAESCGILEGYMREAGNIIKQENL